MADGIAAAIRMTPDAELTAVVGRTSEGARAFAGRHGAARAHEELAAALRDDVDAVYVGSPNTLHAEHAALALEAGKHVLCDKPLATDVATAQRLLAVAAAKHVALSVNFQVRQHPAVATIRAWLRDGRVGHVVAVRATVAFGPEDLVGWRSDVELAGAGALYNLGVHAIDTVLAVIDQRPLSVSCALRPEGAALDRTAAVTIGFDGGAVATVLASQEIADDDVRLEILGGAGRITWDGWMAPYRRGPLILRQAAEPEVAEDVECPDAYERVVRNFTDAVRSGRVPTPAPNEALLTVQIVEGARTAARLSSVVAL